MCATVKINKRHLSTPRELRAEMGRLVWRKDYEVCEPHDVWLDRCLCSIDIPASVEAAGRAGCWEVASDQKQFILEPEFHPAIRCDAWARQPEDALSAA